MVIEQVQMILLNTLGPDALDRIILAPQNNDVDRMNNQLLSRTASEEQVFYSVNSIAQEAGADDKTLDMNMFPIKFLHTLTTSGLPLGELQPKPSCLLHFQTSKPLL